MTVQKNASAIMATHATTALGRAYVKNLLGTGTEAEARYTAAKRFMRIAERLFPGSGYRCALDTSPRGGVSASEDNHDRDLQRPAMVHG